MGFALKLYLSNCFNWQICVMNHTVSWLLVESTMVPVSVSHCHSGGGLVSSHIWQRTQSRVVLWKWAETNLGLILNISPHLTWVTSQPPSLPADKQRTLRAEDFSLIVIGRHCQANSSAQAPCRLVSSYTAFMSFTKLNYRIVKKLTKLSQVFKLKIFIAQSGSSLFCLQVGVHLPSVLKVK